MNSPETTRAALAAITFAALFVGSNVGDHWIQNDHDAITKDGTGWAARRADAHHVITLTITQAVALLGVHLATGATWHLGALAAALTVNAITHYIADRRAPLRWLAERTGKGNLWTLGAPRPDHDDGPALATGAYALDQSWHLGWLFVAALLAAL